jgi:ABC-2 type transport system permease protein
VTDIGHRAGGLDALRAWWQREIRRPTGGSFAARTAQIYRRRDVLRMLVTRDLKRKYANSYLGYAWTLLDPALMIGIYWLVWGRVARLGIHDYVLFLATAMMPWMWFRAAVGASTTVISGSARMVTSISLPREIYPIGLTLTKMVEFFITLPMVWVLALLYHNPPTIWLLAMPFAVLLELLLVVGVALMLSALATLFRDVDRALHSFMRILFYLTPVIYPTGRLHGKIHDLFVLNPLVGIFDMHRAAFFPETVVTGQMVMISVIGSLFFFVFGWGLFIKLERQMLKEL